MTDSILGNENNQEVDLHDLLKRKVIGIYLRDEVRYDKWGALGKILLIEEALKDETFAGMKVDQSRYAQLANAIFPRTFSCSTPRIPPSEEIQEIKSYMHEISYLFQREGMASGVAERLAWEETREKFCIAEENPTAFL